MKVVYWRTGILSCGRQLSFADFVIGISGFKRYPMEDIIDSWIGFDRFDRAKLTGRTSYAEPGRLVTCRPRFVIREQGLILGR